MGQDFDVIVVGSGNAGFCAAHAASENGARVLLLEKAGEEWLGGNSYFTAGAFRTTFDGVENLVPLLGEPDDSRIPITELDAYRAEDFVADMRRVTAGRCDAELTAILAGEAADTMRWLHGHGLRFRLMYDRQAYEVDGAYRFWGNLILATVDGGKGLVAQHLEAAERNGIEIRCDAPVDGLVRGADGAVTGVVSRGETLSAPAIVLAAGGFQADAAQRTAFLGSGWELAAVRGTPHNTGTVLKAALECGAQSAGQWSGCHSVAWDAAAPRFGDRELTNRYTKQSYPIGLVVNAEGQRFVDEGADFRNYTYAKYGAEILKQPGGIAFQLFDGQTKSLLRETEYEAPGVSRHEAQTIHELADSLGIDPDALERTISEFNAAVGPAEFNPTIKDGKRTEGIEPPKSNWALPLTEPPFLAFPVCCGITFTFGGVRIGHHGQVLDAADTPIPGLYAAGEMVGGLFYYNYPGGSGLTAGAVFGSRAGRHAAAYVQDAGRSDSVAGSAA